MANDSQEERAGRLLGGTGFAGKKTAQGHEAKSINCLPVCVSPSSMRTLFGWRLSLRQECGRRAGVVVETFVSPASLAVSVLSLCAVATRDNLVISWWFSYVALDFIRLLASLRGLQMSSTSI